MMKKQNWKAHTREDRVAAIGKIEEVIAGTGGYIVHFNQFSDLALSLLIEIEEHRVADLHAALRSVLNISDLDDENLHPESTLEWIIFINISFTCGKGDLCIEVPAVPG